MMSKRKSAHQKNARVSWNHLNEHKKTFKRTKVRIAFLHDVKRPKNYKKAVLSDIYFFFLKIRPGFITEPDGEET